MCINIYKLIIIIIIKLKIINKKIIWKKSTEWSKYLKAINISLIFFTSVIFGEWFCYTSTWVLIFFHAVSRFIIVCIYNKKKINFAFIFFVFRIILSQCNQKNNNIYNNIII